MHERNHEEDITHAAEWLEDGRDDLPLALHHELDDLAISPEAMRVYVHLVRRVGRNGAAWPSYQNIGRHCFGRAGRWALAKPATLKRRAIEAVQELEAAGLIRRRGRVREDGTQSTNVYTLTPRREWGPAHED